MRKKRYETQFPALRGKFLNEKEKKKPSSSFSFKSIWNEIFINKILNSGTKKVVLNFNI